MPGSSLPFIPMPSGVPKNCSPLYDLHYRALNQQETTLQSFSSVSKTLCECMLNLRFFRVINLLLPPPGYHRIFNPSMTCPTEFLNLPEKFDPHTLKTMQMHRDRQRQTIFFIDIDYNYYYIIPSK